MDITEATWDMIAAKMVALEESQSQPAAQEPIGIMEKMQRLKEKMGFNKPAVGATPCPVDD